MNILFFQNRRKGVPRAGLMAAYDFTEGAGQTLTDRTGNGYNGILGLTTGAEASDPTWVSAGLSFDGVDDSVQIPSVPASNGTDTFLFLMPPTIATILTTVYNRGVQSTTVGFIWIYREPTASSLLRIQFCDGIAFRNIAITASASEFATGDLISLVIDWPNKILSVYQNGTFVRTVALTAPNPIVLPAAGTAYLGVYQLTQHRLIGTMSYFGHYTRLLSSGEVGLAYRNIKRLLAARGVTVP